MTIVIIVIVVALLAGGAFFLFARKPAEQLPPGEKKPEALPPAEKAQPRIEAKKPSKQDLVQTVREAAGERKPKPLAPEEIAPEKPVSVPAGAVSAPPSRPKRDVSALRKGLAASRGGFIAKLRALFTGKKEIDPAILEQIEEVMLTSDVGVKTTHAILARLRERLERHELSDENAVWDALRAEATDILSIGRARRRARTRGSPPSFSWSA